MRKIFLEPRKSPINSQKKLRAPPRSFRNAFLLLLSVSTMNLFHFLTSKQRNKAATCLNMLTFAVFVAEPVELNYEVYSSEKLDSSNGNDKLSITWRTFHISVATRETLGILKTQALFEEMSSCFFSVRSRRLFCIFLSVFLKCDCLRLVRGRGYTVLHIKSQ